jgi:predicted metalloprotease with PDZ domain
MRTMFLWLAVSVALVLAGRVLLSTGDPASPIHYRISVADPAQHVLSVDMTVADIPTTPLELRMSRASPGRYALHDFIGAVADLQVTGSDGRALAVTRQDGFGWTVSNPTSTVRVRYRVRGNRLDGTYLAVDASHAHINMPAAVIWARGLEQRPIRVSFELPAKSGWRVATQLLPGGTSVDFTAPNLQYLMDSPAELSAHDLRTFTVDDDRRTATFRLALHHAGGPDDADRYAKDLKAIATEATIVFGGLPAFESPAYTFLADFLLHAAGDGMEHRNSTVLTSSGTIVTARASLVEKAAHEVFHAWNIERIRPRSLEPFDFERENVSGELWFGEGVTNYYGRLLTARAGVIAVEQLAADLGGAIDVVTRSTARQHRSVVESSRLAPLVDGASSEQLASIDGGYLSYYVWGEAIALALDLHLRQRSNHRVTLDHLMRALWQRFGAIDGPQGYVSRPYENVDVQTALAEVTGDVAFAHNFMDRYVFGNELPEFGPLLTAAGFTIIETTHNSRTGTLAEKRFEVVPVERNGGRLVEEQRMFRQRWAGAQR